MEGVGRPQMAVAEELDVFFHEGFADDLEIEVGRIELRGTGEADPSRLEGDGGLRLFLLEQARDIAGEPLLDGGHAEFAGPGHPFLADLHALVDPVFRERASVPFDVGHPLPGKIGRADQEFAGFQIGEAELGQGVVPDALDADDAERGVDAVHRQEVELALPPVPVPPGAGVAERAVVEHDAVLVKVDDPDLGGDGRQRFREIELVAAPGELAVGGVFQVVVERGRNRDAVVAAEHDLAVLRLDLEDVFAVVRRNDLDGELRVAGAEDATDQGAGGLCGGRSIGLGDGGSRLRACRLRIGQRNC